MRIKKVEEAIPFSDRRVQMIKRMFVIVIGGFFWWLTAGAGDGNGRPTAARFPFCSHLICIPICSRPGGLGRSCQDKGPAVDKVKKQYPEFFFVRRAGIYHGHTLWRPVFMTEAAEAEA